MWRKNLSYDKTWSDFKKLLAENYCDPCKLQHINVTQAGFCEANIAIKIQDYIVEALDNLAMATASENMYSHI